MKKILLSLFVLTSVLFGVNVNAEEVKIEELDANTYIVGNRVFEPTEYYLTVFDIVEATREYLNVNPKATEVPIYLVEQTDEGVVLSKVLGAAKENNELPLEEVEKIEDVFADGIIDAGQINGETVLYVDKIDENKDDILFTKAGELNTTASKYGFTNIVYSKDTNTATFAIDTDRKDELLYKFAATGIATMFLDNVDGFTKIAVEGVETPYDVNSLNADKIIEIAAGLLANMAGKDIEYANELTLADVIGEKTVATFYYEINGEEKSLEYTLSFVEDTKAKTTDSLLEEKAGKLNETAQNYGFTNIAYNKLTNTAMFVIDVDKKEEKLVKFAATGIVEMFLEKIDGFTKIKVEGIDTYAVNSLDPNKVIEIAAAILANMAGRDVEDASELTLADVAGKSSVATFYYIVDGVELSSSYTLSFKEDAKAVNTDKVLGEKANKLAETAGSHGFTNIVYKKDTNTATFFIDADKNNEKLVKFAATGIVEMFLQNVDGFTKIEIEGFEEPYYVNSLDANKVVEIAAAILANMAEVDVEEASELTLADVAEKSAVARFYYIVDGVELSSSYTLSFKEDAKAKSTDEILTTKAGELNVKGTTYGFESITYNTLTNTATFKINQEEQGQSLVAFAATGIVEMFLQNVDGFTKIEIEGFEEPYYVNSLDANKVVEIAAAILANMAEVDVEEASELTLADVAGKSAVARFYYIVDGVELSSNYTLIFE